jgi:hypothetical protein
VVICTDQQTMPLQKMQWYERTHFLNANQEAQMAQQFSRDHFLSLLRKQP